MQCMFAPLMLPPPPPSTLIPTKFPLFGVTRNTTSRERSAQNNTDIPRIDPLLSEMPEAWNRMRRKGKVPPARKVFCDRLCHRLLKPLAERIIECERHEGLIMCRTRLNYSVVFYFLFLFSFLNKRKLLTLCLLFLRLVLSRSSMRFMYRKARILQDSSKCFPKSFCSSVCETALKYFCLKQRTD